MDQKEFSIRLVPMKDKIFRFARSILYDVAESEDVTQGIFERLWAGRDRLDGCRNLDAFVMVCVKNLCYDRIRRRRLRHEGVGDPETSAPCVAAEGAEESDTVSVMMKVIAGLPETQRTVLHLRDIEGYEFNQIAVIMDMNEPAVRVTLSRARKAVREKMIKIMEYGTHD